jgi:hypothetical protein
MKEGRGGRTGKEGRVEMKVRNGGKQEKKEGIVFTRHDAVLYPSRI